jgi:formylglycine-generating enzyme required for sulfatase activity
MKSPVLAVLVCVMLLPSLASADTFGTGSNQFAIDFVLISGATNPTSGYGIVHNDYRMGVYEISNDQWNKFKAACGPVAGNPSGAYSQDPEFTSANVPTNNVSWVETAQFVNWLNTSTGHQVAYKFTDIQGTSNYTFTTWASTDAGYNAGNPYRNSYAYYFLPTEDEWVKAAYWNGRNLQTYATKAGQTLYQGNGSNGGWNYSNTYPSALNSPWATSSGSQELNGTYNMMGNLWEWTESPWTSGDYLAVLVNIKPDIHRIIHRN